MQRLRDGVAPKAWRTAVGLAILIVGGAAIVTLEVLNRGFRAWLPAHPRGFSLVLLPAFLAALGVYFAVTWAIRRAQDRRMVAAVRGKTAPEFFVPVVRNKAGGLETEPAARPRLWAVDSAGLTGWVPESADPVVAIA